MGCASSSGDDKNLKVATQRRRLSVGEVDKGTEQDEKEVQEVDRGLISALQAEDVINMLHGEDGRKFSVSSATDQSKTSFANKSMQELGDKIDHAAQCMG